MENLFHEQATCAELTPENLHGFDPVQLLPELLVEFPVLNDHRSALCVILTELYNNALDHGVLRLDSKLKNSAEGFVEYYSTREALLKDLQEGYIRFDVLCQSDKIMITVQDSGEGFDYEKHLNKEFNHQHYSGRGIPLIQSLCEEIIFKENGSCVEVVYNIQTDPQS